MGKVVYINKYKNEGIKMITKEDALKIAKYTVFFANNATQRLYKTKLNKLLFYTQFLYYKEYGYRLLEQEFVKDHYGPVLDRLDEYIDILLEIDVIEIDKTDYGTTIVPKLKLHDKDYDPRELRILNKVQGKFDDFSAKEISDYSHRERLWIETKLKDIIDLEKVEELNEF